jgi:hypothetical protein
MDGTDDAAELGDDAAGLGGDDAAEARPPAPARLVAPGEPAGAAVAAVLQAVGEGKITPKLAREVPVRLIPPAKPTVRLRLPAIVDGASYAAACRRIMRASATGKIAPGDAVLLMRGAKAAWDTARAEQRQRQRLLP